MSITRLAKLSVVALCGIFTLAGCQSATKKGTSTSGADSALATTAALPDSASFKQTIQGKQVNLFVLKNAAKATVAITNYGGRIVSLVVPDKNGKPVDVVLGSD